MEIKFNSFMKELIKLFVEKPLKSGYWFTIEAVCNRAMVERFRGTGQILWQHQWNLKLTLL